MKPILKLLPLRPAVTSDRTIALEVLAQINVPEAPSQRPSQRPPLNLALVLDRSGSMAGQKLDYAKQAACFAVEQLLPSDRISFTVFDDTVQTLIPSTLATDKATLLATIQRVETGGCTALHEGWVQGGLQVSQHLQPQALNRVILLSDGLANQGETNPAVIAEHVRGLSQRGVSTTTMGLGRDYDEDLLAAMASQGDGNFVHIESPQQLPDFFATELRGLMSTLGRQVSLGIRPQGAIALDQVLNQLERTSYGNWMLPNLIHTHTISVVFRLIIPPQSQSQALVSVRLAWNDPHQSDRQSLYEILSLPVVSGAQWDQLGPQEEVQRQLAILEAAIARDEIIQALDAGDAWAAAQCLSRAQAVMAQAPAAPSVAYELSELDTLERSLAKRDMTLSRKQAKSQAYRAHRGNQAPDSQPDS